MRNSLGFFYRLHDPSTTGITGHTGNEGDAVICCGLEITPIGVADSGDGLDLVGSTPLGGGIGDGIAHL